MVLEPGDRVGVADGLVQAGGALEGNGALDAGHDEGCDLVVGREELGPQPSGPELGALTGGRQHVEGPSE